MRLEIEGVQEIGPADLMVEYTATVEVSYRPWRFSGPPEDCYEDESEVDILSTVTDPPGHEGALDEEEICDRAWEAFAQREKEGP